jgi:hypothetical protein
VRGGVQGRDGGWDASGPQTPLRESGHTYMFVPPMTRPRTKLLAGFTAMMLVSSGCVGLGTSSASTVGFVDLERPEMQGFAVASMTDIERDVRLETSEKLTPALFWTGIAVGTVGAVGGVAFGVAGYVSKRQLTDGYDNGITMDERDALTSRGQTFNTLAVAMTTIAVLGYALAIVTYGVDWNRCGPLVRKNEKRRCADLE